MRDNCAKGKKEKELLADIEKLKKSAISGKFFVDLDMCGGGIRQYKIKSVTAVEL